MKVQEDTSARTTTERILDAAEGLFAKQGILATSLREITDLAEVNIAAVNYHFRSKDALVQAVYERSFQPLNAERLRLLDAAEAAAGDGPLPLETVLNAMFEPMVRAWQVNRNFILLVGRLQHQPDPELGGYIQTLYRELIARFIAAAKRAEPDVSEDDLFFWIHFLFGGVVYTLLNHQDMQRLYLGQDYLEEPEVFLKRLIDFGVGGIRTCRPGRSRAAGARQKPARRIP